MTIVPGVLSPTALKDAIRMAPTLRPGNTGGSSDARLAALRADVDRHLSTYLNAQRTEYLRASPFATLYDDLAEFVCRPGKRIRPLLFLLAEQVFGRGQGSVTEPSRLAIGSSLELLHAFILVHDDIIDRAETRRGRPTLHRIIESRLSSFSDRGRAGRNLALVMGDILFALAQRCLLEAEVPAGIATRLGTMMLECMIDTGFGEVADIVHSTRDVAKVNADEIEQMYRLKTTCYTIACPLKMAAVLHGVDAAGLDALGRIAGPAGLAFQIQNDLQEFARFEVSDAEVPADILEGKKTLLMRVAYDLLDENDRGFLQLCFSSATPTEGTISKARELISKSGAVGRLNARMDELFAEADAQTYGAPFAADIREGLHSLVLLVRDVARP